MTFLDVPPYNYHPDLRTARDVRHMAGCSYCGGIGDRRHMIVRAHPASYQHGRCYIRECGLSVFLALPRIITDQLYLDDIGDEAMKALLERGA